MDATKDKSDAQAAPKLYVMFDGETVDGTRYAHGEPLKDGVSSGVIQLLRAQGRLSETQPVAASIAMGMVDKPTSTMSRADLESTMVAIMAERMANASDEELRASIERHNEAKEAGDYSFDAGSDDSMTGGEDETYAGLKDKPLSALKTVELQTVADAEGVNLDDAKTNPDRVTAIQAARDAKSKAATDATGG